VALRPSLYVGSLPVACAAQAAGGCRESPGKSELIDTLGRDDEKLGDVRHLPQLDLVSAEEHVSEASRVDTDAGPAAAATESLLRQ
jgi:hypothetical protein